MAVFLALSADGTALSADGNVLAGRGATLGSIEWTAYRLVLR
jgi:hypothetical protein